MDLSVNVCACLRACVGVCQREFVAFVCDTIVCLIASGAQVGSCVCAYLRARMSTYVCMRACVCLCGRACTQVWAGVSLSLCAHVCGWGEGMLGRGDSIRPTYLFLEFLEVGGSRLVQAHDDAGNDVVEWTP